MDLLAKITETIFEYNLLKSGEKIVIAVSGGPDSTALVDLLIEFRDQYCSLDIALACMDHGLWPEAREDIENISALARRYQLEFFWEEIKLLDGGNTAIEERGRELRYRFLERIALKFGAYKVAVGHHANDQAETLLFRLLKGSGIYGLSAMPYIRPISEGSPVNLVRPLLRTKKNDLIAYLDKKGIDWWNDPSNYDSNYTRNHTRHKIIPFLEQGYPELISTLTRTANRCREIVDYLEQEADCICQAVSDWCLAKPDLREYFFRLEGKNRVCAMSGEKWDAILPALLPAVVRKIFSKIGAPEISLRESHYQMLKKPGKKVINLPHGVMVWRTSSTIFFILEKTNDFLLPGQLAVPGCLQITSLAKIHAKLLDISTWKRRKTSLLEVGLHAPSLPLNVRLRQPGDTIRPLGSPGKRKVSRILADIKMPYPMRDAVVVVCDRIGEILWLPGICIADSRRITQKTQQVLVLNFTSVINRT